MDSNSEVLLREFLGQSVFRMEECTGKIRACVDMLDDASFWYRPNPSSNSVGQLLAHLSGNIRQYILSGLLGRPDVRRRSLEFEYPEERDRQDVESRFFQVAGEAVEAIGRVSEGDLLRWRKVQGFDLSGLGIVLHVVEHLSYHTGQIAYLTKLRLDNDLGFYKGIDLNAKNE